ncbi:MAG: monovalent cation:proton antiporter-2 (CPA2) family protein [Alphaproteobacteria bacterium]|jgi:CPA2 family monovalent cation:H+ antiporter-2
MHPAPLLDIVILLAAAVGVVTVFRALKLSPVLGYLVAGAVIGPFGLTWIKNVEATASIAELGVALLLFMIGLELSWDRLKTMRRKVFGIGGAQVLLTGGLLTMLVLLRGESVALALLIGGGLALSSTALVLQVLDERRETASQTGRLSIAILILQDLTAIPLLVLVPLLAGGGGEMELLSTLTRTGINAMLAMLLILILGRLVLRPLFRYIARLDIRELFAATTLLVVLGIAWAADAAGLSWALGAFFAGILVAETEFRHQVEADVKPYKGLLMGLFFMTVGMKMDLDFIVDHTAMVLAASFALISIKGLMIYGILRGFGYTKRSSGHTALLLAQGGEFGFILFGIAGELGVMAPTTAKFLMLVIAVTMALTPLLDMLGGKLEREWRKRARLDTTPEIEEESRDLSGHVVIAGYGRMGGIIADVMARETIPFIAMDTNPRHVTRGRRRHHPVYFGDAGRPDVLEAVGVKRARLILLTSHDILKNEAALRALRSAYPELPIFARAKDGGDAERLYALGATLVVPEVYVSSMRLLSRILTELEWPEPEIARVMDTMRHFVAEAV